MPAFPREGIAAGAVSDRPGILRQGMRRTTWTDTGRRQFGALAGGDIRGRGGTDDVRNSGKLIAQNSQARGLTADQKTRLGEAALTLAANLSENLPEKLTDHSTGNTPSCRRVRNSLVRAELPLRSR